MKTNKSISQFFFVLLNLLFSLQAAGAANDPRPLASASIYKQLPFKTALPCARGCLSYEGGYSCGYGMYTDLAMKLGCSCDYENFCYCNSDYGAAATRYVSTCVKYACGDSAADVSQEISNMLSIYDGYCATAIGAASSTTGSSFTSPATAPAQTTAEGTGTTSTDGGLGDAVDNSSSDHEGLGQSDVVALAASLGVGVPSVLITAVTLWVMIRRRRQHQEVSPSESTYHLRPLSNEMSQ